jgi:hypothetical protein
MKETTWIVHMLQMLNSCTHTHTQISQPVELVSDSMQQQGELMGIMPKHGIHDWTQDMSWWLKAHHSFSV